MTRLKPRSLFLAMLSLLAIVLSAGPGQVASADSPGGVSSGPRPLSPASGTFFTNAPFSPLTLTSASGANITAVVYDGNVLLKGGPDANTVTMTGFGTVPAGARAKATYVVADGQCGATSANGCFTTAPTAGSTDTLAFNAFSDGPDAFKGRGSDQAGVNDTGAGCPWGIPAQGGDTCLWDTRSFDVTPYVAPGDVSVSTTVTAGGGLGGSDCLNDQARVFAVGPAAAWATAGYVASGKGLRNQGSGNITIAGIPVGATVKRAELYWNILNDTDPGTAMQVNGHAVAGSMYASAGSPCWLPLNSFAYRADVSSLVPGNGVYALSGYPTGDASGQSPWIASQAPQMEGASLIVFYQSQPCDEQDGDGNIKDEHSDKHSNDNRDVKVKFDSDDNNVQCGDQEQEEEGDSSDEDRQQVDSHDNRDGSDFHSSSIQSVESSAVPGGKKATILGAGTHNGVPVTFVLIAIDNGPSLPGYYGLDLSDGYSVAGNLVDGSISLP